MTTTTGAEAPQGFGRGGRWVGPTVGILVLIGLWELLAYTYFGSNHLVPPPQQVIVTLFHDPGFALWPNLQVTLEEAALGFVWGNLVAISLALAFVLFPILERAFLPVVLATYCMPIIAIGPILEIMLSGTAPQIALSGLSVLFTTLIGCLIGLRSADPVSLDLVQVYGGGRWRKLTKVRIRAALPASFAGLAISGPAAVLGAIIGEYLGASRGLGVALISANENLDSRRSFAIALVATAIAGIAYVVISIVGRALTPWAPRRAESR